MDLFKSSENNWETVWDAIRGLPPATEPSETALRVSGTIKERIVNHGY
jgi:DNA (cytosine-5)-methyltransferase 1